MAINKCYTILGLIISILLLGCSPKQFNESYSETYFDSMEPTQATYAIENWMFGYYLNPEPQKTISAIRTMFKLKYIHANQGLVWGFLNQVFLINNDKAALWEERLKSDLGPRDINFIHSARVYTLSTHIRRTSDISRLFGAFYATGKKSYIEEIIVKLDWAMFNERTSVGVPKRDIAAYTKSRLFTHAVRDKTIFNLCSNSFNLLSEAGKTQLHDIVRLATNERSRRIPGRIH